MYNKWNNWDPLEVVMLGKHYDESFFYGIKNQKIKACLVRITNETNQDLDYFDSVLKDFGCQVIRPFVDKNDNILNHIDQNGALHGAQGVPRSPLQPRDHQLVVGNKCISTGKDYRGIHQSLLDYDNNTVMADELPLPKFKYNEIACFESGDWPAWEDYFLNQEKTLQKLRIQKI